MLNFSTLIIENWPCTETDPEGRMYDLQCLTCMDADSDEDCVNNGKYMLCEQGVSALLSLNI